VVASLCGSSSCPAPGTRDGKLLGSCCLLAPVASHLQLVCGGHVPSSLQTPPHALPGPSSSLVFLLAVLRPELEHFSLALRGRARQCWHQQCQTWQGATRGSLMGPGAPCQCSERSVSRHFDKSHASMQAIKLSGL